MRRPAPAARLPRLTRPLIRRLALLGLAAAVVLLAPSGWLRLASVGHVHAGTGAVRAPVVIVFGAQLAPGGTQPMPFLRGRLDTAAGLVRSGRATAVLVSGDAHGGSGDEVTAMSRYLADHGVPERRIVADGYGLDSYDTCRRAHDVYGVRRALLVSQGFHLPRAVALCRAMGVDSDGVAAGCAGCQQVTIVYNTVREVPAAWKALYDRVSGRPPAVSSPPNQEIAAALRD
ncbi:SanA/YdcF family protein [Planosporangium sp. 12N6]|uniref:SanA/YdcF family protein n=1 Tax=Planosporangium spinosum TaxID=3402278 RepID=UPI003CF4CE5C